MKLQERLFRLQEFLCFLDSDGVTNTSGKPATSANNLVLIPRAEVCDNSAIPESAPANPIVARIVQNNSDASPVSQSRSKQLPRKFRSASIQFFSLLIAQTGVSSADWPLCLCR
jgi:hypothetical protein